MNCIQEKLVNSFVHKFGGKKCCWYEEKLWSKKKWSVYFGPIEYNLEIKTQDLEG